MRKGSSFYLMPMIWKCNPWMGQQPNSEFQHPRTRSEQGLWSIQLKVCTLTLARFDEKNPDIVTPPKYGNFTLRHPKSTKSDGKNILICKVNQSYTLLTQLDWSVLDDTSHPTCRTVQRNCCRVHTTPDHRAAEGRTLSHAHQHFSVSQPLFQRDERTRLDPHTTMGL
jgi:hypothetical protein